jgi:hypothetical protein
MSDWHAGCSFVAKRMYYAVLKGWNSGIKTTMATTPKARLPPPKRT